MTRTTLDEVETYLATSRRRTPFPSSIEETYQRERLGYRRTAIRNIIGPSILIYNAFLPIDYILLPGTALLATVLHLAATAWLVLCAFLLKGERTPLFYEILCVTMPAAIVAQIVTVFTVSADIVRTDYQFLAVVIVVYANTIMRPSARIAGVASAAIGALYLAALLFADVPASTKLVGSTAMASMIYVTLLANARMEQDTRYAFVRRLQDRLCREKAETEAQRDPLTGLLNRRSFDAAGERLWQDTDMQIAILMLDVDFFKTFNDSLGHPAGDACLRSIAGAISLELRAGSDVAARIGGEEFAILLPRADTEAARVIAERLRLAVEQLPLPRINGRNVTVSLGIASGHTRRVSLRDLIFRADAELYAAKRAGRNVVSPPASDPLVSEPPTLVEAFVAAHVSAD